MSDQRPDARELVEAVREFLEREVQPKLEGSTAFHARVAVNVLAIVERELAEGAALDAGERERLVALLGEEGELGALNERLVARIRVGELTVDDPALVAHLRATILGRLGIDNPRYGSYQRALGRG
ncbi:MAG: DUF6285 domain-containing protein [Pseudomonadales bacterium]|jgi:hypothetical protein|nr:DUF6285 domain-containing protein [Pseudomonadales bacterium]